MVSIHQLSNGLRVVVKSMEWTHSCAIGVWLRVGSILESEEENGLSHLLEHMSFKGTKNRSNRQLAIDMDAIGGQVNAATSKLTTEYYAQVLPEEAESALELLSDIVCNTVIEPAELEKEKRVIIEEIGMVEDSPEDSAHDMANALFYLGGPLSQPILGSRARVESFSAETVESFRAKHYVANNAVLSVAGNFDENRLLEWCEKYFGRWKKGNRQEYPANPTNNKRLLTHTKKPIEQAQILFTYPGMAFGAPLGKDLLLLSSILGGGSSSRLFQRIREEKAYAYSVYAHKTAYPFCGDLAIYAACSPKNTRVVCDIIEEECKLVLDKGVTEEELCHSRIGEKTTLALADESVYYHMSKMGSDLMTYSRIVPHEEIFEGLNKVTTQSILLAARESIDKPCALVLLSPDEPDNHSYWRKYERQA
ncbi:MAG: M16 family metallopeptidase [Christensenellales bacterium]|jgi:predicted Zn-dependent peptidase